MTVVLGVPRPVTYYGGGSVSPYEDEFVSPTAVYPLPEPPEPPSKDDSADVSLAEVLRSVYQFGEGSEAEQSEPHGLGDELIVGVYQFGEGSEAKLISPKTADAGGPRWRGVEERHFTSRIAENFSTPPDALLGLEQIEKIRKETLSESLQTAVPNVLDNSKRPYNILTGWPSLIVLSQKTEHPSGAFLGYVRSFERVVKSSMEEDVPAPLAEALRDLSEINDEAEEEGIAPPSELAITNADRLIRATYDILPRQYLVELLPEGVIAIRIPGGFRRSVMLLCESDGGALCSVNMSGKHRRKRYPHTDQLPDRFIREALSELGQE